MTKLKITKENLEKLIDDHFPDHFKIIFDDIPMYHPEHIKTINESHRDYVEDDGREFRWCIFVDNKTDIEHCVNYTYHPNWQPDITNTPSSIIIVDKIEDCDVQKLLVPIVLVKTQQLTLEQIADRELLDRYKTVNNLKIFDKKMLSNAIIKDLCIFVKSKNYNLYQLRNKFLNICIEYGIDEKSLWIYIQQKVGHWKK